MKYNHEKGCKIWHVTGGIDIPEIIAVQSNTVSTWTSQLYFSQDENYSLEKIMFTFDEDTASAARILVKILLRLGIAPEAALETAKKFYRMTKEFPQGYQLQNLSSNA